MAACATCKANLPQTAYNKTQWARAAKGNRGHCRTCLRERARARTYALPWATFVPDRLLLQGGVCGVPGCTRELTDESSVVDHDHEHDFVRGIICHRCNRVIGFVRDDPQLLRGLALYIEHSPGAVERGHVPLPALPADTNGRA